MASSITSNAEGELRRARAELESDLRADKNRRAEELLVAYPAVAADTDAALELVYTEYVVRDQMGQKPTPDEWYQRFPQYRADLEQMFEVHNELCKAEHNSLSHTRTAGRPSANLLGRVPGRIAGYEILGEVGRGGMGVVYKARQMNLNRIVALKVILSGAYAGEHERSRFRREAEAAARLDHPHIVGVYEVGEQDGRPFCAMEFVGGGTLADRLTGAPWSAINAASLLSVVARAAHHAHERGVVHRDLKPANILISQVTKSLNLQLGSKDEPANTTRATELTVDDLANPKVADFGLAKCLTGSDPGPTRTGDVVGTPAYMAPEQAAAKSGTIGPATDVWAIGVMLYELLTGRAPFRGESAVETLIQIRTEDPVSPRQLRPQLPRELDTICLKCLEKEPAKRYASAAELADDLDRWLRGEPVHALPLAWPGRFTRWCRRNPRVAGLSGAVAFLLLLAAALGGIVSLNLAAARDDAERNANQEREARQIEVEARKREEAARKREEAARLQEEAARKVEQENLAREQARVVHLHVADGVQRLEEGDNAGAAVSFAVALQKETDPAAQRIQRMRLDAVLRSCPRLVRVSNLASRYAPSEYSLLEGDALNEIGPNGQYVTDNNAILFDAVTPPDGKPYQVQVLSSDGRCAIAIGTDRVARAWEINTKTPIALPRPSGSSTFPPPFSPDGHWFVDAPLTPGTKKLRIYDATNGKPVGVEQTFAEFVDGLRFTPDGKRVLVIATNAYLFDLETGEPVGEPMRLSRRIRVSAISPDGRWIVTAGDGPALQIWDANTSKPHGPRLPMADNAFVIAFSRDSKQFATWSIDRTVRVWNVETSRLNSVVLAELDAITTLAFRPDGKQLATGSQMGVVRMWDVASGRAASPMLHSNSPIWRILFSPDGRTLTALNAARLHTWELDPSIAPVALLGPPVNNYVLAWNPDGSSIVTAGQGGAKLWDAKGTAGPVFTHPGSPNVWHAEFNKEGTRIVTCGLDGARVWNTKTGEAACRPLESGQTATATFSPDGQRIATLDSLGLIKFWNAATGAPSGLEIPSLKNRMIAAFSPDGKRLIAQTALKTATVFDSVTGKVQFELTQADYITDSRFSPDGKHVATSSAEGEITLWDLETGKQVGNRFGQKADSISRFTLQRFEFSSDGSKLLTAGWNRSAQVWDVKTNRLTSLPMRHIGEITRAIFSNDGRLVATCSWDGNVRVWDAASGQPVTMPIEHGMNLKLIAFSPDSRYLVTSTEMGPARVWELTSDARPADEIGAFAQLLANRRADERGVLVPLTSDEEMLLWKRFKPRVK